MTTPSLPIYTDNGEETWTDLTYGSTTIFRNISRSVAYLKQQIDALNTQTDPQQAKVFTPINIDTAKSYGFELGTLVGVNNNFFVFDGATNHQYTQMFNTRVGVDLQQTTAYIDLAQGFASLQPLYGVDVKTAANYAGPVRPDIPVPDYSPNACWEVGWDETDAYWVTQSTYNNPWTSNIPTVSRAMVFTVTAGNGGLCNNVSLIIEGDVNAEDDIYLELRNVTGSGMTAKPGTTIYERVKGEAKTFSQVKFLSFPFPYPVRLTAGSQYCLVVRSPFTSWQNHYGLGGWGINCGPVYTGGMIYTSYDNCHTWMKHGQASPALPYHEGQREPANWGFLVQTSTETTYYASNSQAVFLSPIKSNPISSVSISTSQTTPSGTTITYYASPDQINWYVLNAGNSFTSTMGGVLPTTVYIQAVLTSSTLGTSGAGGGITPTLSEIVVNLLTAPATKAYLRSAIYYPPTTQPLGLNIWSEIDAQYEADPNTTMEVELMSGTMRTDRFIPDGTTKNYTLTYLPAEPLEYVVSTVSATTATELKEGKDFTVNYNTGVLSILGTALATTAILKVQYYPLLIKGLTLANLPLRLDYQSQSFTATGGQTVFQLPLPVGDPVRSLTVNGINKIENIDYSVNYQTNQITLNIPSTTGDIVVIDYTPEIKTNGLAINYRATRSNTTNNVAIYPSLYQYRV